MNGAFLLKLCASPNLTTIDGVALVAKAAVVHYVRDVQKAVHLTT